MVMIGKPGTAIGPAAQHGRAGQASRPTPSRCDPSQAQLRAREVRWGVNG